MTKPLKQIHLAAHFPGVNNTTVWSDPRSGSHIEFSSFAHLARTAERAKFDFLFLAEGLRLREQNGVIYDLDVEAADLARARGIDFVRAGTAGTHPRFVTGLAELVRGAMSNGIVACAPDCCQRAARPPLS